MLLYSWLASLSCRLVSEFYLSYYVRVVLYLIKAAVYSKSCALDPGPLPELIENVAGRTTASSTCQTI